MALAVYMYMYMYMETSTDTLSIAPAVDVYKTEMRTPPLIRTFLFCPEVVRNRQTPLYAVQQPGEVLSNFQ